jgi:hypothetical protein
MTFVALPPSLVVKPNTSFIIWSLVTIMSHRLSPNLRHQSQEVLRGLGVSLKRTQPERGGGMGFGILLSSAGERKRSCAEIFQSLKASVISPLEMCQSNSLRFQDSVRIIGVTLGFPVSIRNVPEQASSLCLFQIATAVVTSVLCLRLCSWGIKKNT